jgi:hypothetical protein
MSATTSPTAAAQERLLRLDPYVCEVGGWLRVSDVVRADGWAQATVRHPELARLLALA